MTFNKNGTIELTREENNVLYDMYEAARDFECDIDGGILVDTCTGCPFQIEEKCTFSKIMNAINTLRDAIDDCNDANE